MIAGDHGHPNAALVAFLDCSYGFIARRIDNPDKAQEDEFLWSTGAIESGFVDLAGFTKPVPAPSGLCWRSPRFSFPKRSIEGGAEATESS